MKIYYLLLLLLFNFILADSLKTYTIKSNAKEGSLVGDFYFDAVITQYEEVRLENSTFSQYFKVNKNYLLVNKSVDLLIGNDFQLDFIVSRQPFQRVVSVMIQIEDASSMYSFLEDTYQTVIRSDAQPETEITFNDKDLKIKNGKELNLHYAPISGPDHHLFTFVNKQDYKEGNYVMLYVKKRLDLLLQSHNLTQKTVSFWLGAFEKKGHTMIASCKVIILIEKIEKPPPVFDNPEGYFLKMNNISAFKNFVRIKAHVFLGAPTYHIENETSPFDVAPWAGDVYATKNLSPGTYEFNVIASDSLEQTSKMPFKIVIDKYLKKEDLILPSKRMKNKIEKSNKRKRELGNDIYFVLKENQALGLLNRTITLYPDESITLAPLIGEYMSVYENGEIKLNKPLNYEVDNEVIMAVQIDGGFKTRIQTIRIEILDVDEPPAFINQPKPYLAVVPHERPIGYQIFRFNARDENGDGDKDVIYNLINTEPPGMFTVDQDTGIVRTAVNKYPSGITCKVYVQVSDKTPMNQNVNQESEIAVLEVVASNRPPQFYKTHYEVSVPQDIQVESSILHIQAKIFKNVDNINHPLFFNVEPRFDLFVQTEEGERMPSQFFSIEPFTGVVHLKKRLDNEDDINKVKTHKLFVSARESGLESKVELTIYTKESNHAPVFTQSIYTNSAKEDIEIGSIVLNVTAFDRDEGDNGKIVYSVSNDNFHVNSNGEVMVRKHLDADQNKDGFFIYRFNVTATDKGNPVKSSTAQIFLTLANTNDEKPRFLPTRLYQASISEDAQGGTPIIQVQAIDPDTDQITYLFVHNGEEVDKTDIFEIDKDNGLIKLRSDVTPAQLMLEYTNYYNLTIIAYDDGSCCEDINSVRHYQTAYVIISIEKSTINNKPEFPDCHKYSALAKLDEGVYKNGPIILRAEAMDKDSGPNGDIIYSLYYSRGESRKPFIIDSTTGDIRPAPHILFDRETKAVEEITVKASDKGERPLIGFCSFFVQINGNRLIFTRPSYEISLSRNVKPGHTVLITKAEDSNPLQNSRITYKLGSDATAGKGHSDDIEYMRILNSEVGEVTLVKRIPSTTSQFIFNIIATDNNLPDPKYIVANIIVNIHEHYQPAPKWQTSSECKESIEVQENVQINSILFKCLAVAGDGSNNPITYKMNNGLTKETNSNGKFREFMETKNGKTWMIIRNMENLDFEQTSQYTLTVTATDMKTQLGREKMFYLKLRDENDKVPRVEVDKFTGSIEEELTPSQYLEKNKGKAIVTVKAIDSDSDGPQNEIHYRILGGNDGSQGGRFFRIDEFTGEIFPETKFDRETNDFFVLDIEASDGMQSSLPGTEGPNRVIIKATILISDKNDNQPTWKSEKHMAHVAENAEIGTEILTMTCEDVDSNSSLKYMIYDKDGSKKRIDFGINSATGSLFVKENLDYETKKSYNLMVMCTDGRFNSSTALEIIIDNIRDIKPLFDKPFYEITINEEDKRVPRKLLKVKAISEDSTIVYKLEGQVDDLFRVDRESGLIEVLKPLDRDGPFGVAVYNFIVSATDDNGKGLISFADVIVRLNDINDNAPFLAKDLMGTVIENRDPGSNGIYVLTAHATDNDDPKTDNAKIEYRISRNKEIDGEPVFRIDENSGKIFAMKKFDRELPSEKHFTIEVLATDKGSPAKKGSANITINILDVNDNAVYFKKDLYEVTVPEDAKIGSAVFTVAPEDEDNEAIDNVFSYELLEKNHEYFYITTENDSNNNMVGLLKVKKVTLIINRKICFEYNN